MMWRLKRTLALLIVSVFDTNGKMVLSFLLRYFYLFHALLHNHMVSFAGCNFIEGVSYFILPIYTSLILHSNYRDLSKVGGLELR